MGRGFEIAIVTHSTLDKASAALFSLPFVYYTTKSYPNNLVNHLCWVGVLIRCSNKYLRLCWSVWIINCCPSKYGCHFWTEMTNAKSFFSFVDNPRVLPFRAWLRYNMGLPSGISTTPIPFPKASHFITEKLGKANMGGLDIACFILWKESIASSARWKAFFFNIAVKGAAMTL